jgi:hypothetical protein
LGREQDGSGSHYSLLRYRKTDEIPVVSGNQPDNRQISDARGGVAE